MVAKERGAMFADFTKQELIKTAIGSLVVVVAGYLLAVEYIGMLGMLILLV